MMDESAEHSPISEQRASQTKILAENNIMALIVECSHEKMKHYAENPPNLEYASVFETNFAKIEVHLLVRCRIHSNIEISIDKIFSLTSNKL
ncbi:hypothetical protein SCA6_017891 [Theobroma cacao]